MSRRTLRAVALIAAAGIAATAPGTLPAQDAQDAPLVLTATQPTWSITRALTRDTAIEVANVPEDGREFAVLRGYLERRIDRYAMLFSAASAVVSLTNALPADPLYRYARAANVRIVDIDAAVPWTYDTPGVALVDTPRTNVEWAEPERAGDAATAPYFWLSISNTIRMADIVASDLARLFPQFATPVAANLDDFKREMLGVRSTYQSRLIAAGDDTVFALTGDFVYLTNDMGLYVDGYFIKQDLEWTDADLAGLRQHLRDRQIGVVIHKWMPSDAIVAAVAAGGAQLVVLETGDPGRITGDSLAVDGLQRILVDNLDRITAALAR